MASLDLYMQMDDVSILDHLDTRPHAIQPRVAASSSTRSFDELGMDVWRYGILLHCDLMALLRLSWVNRSLRTLLHTPEFVVEYQSVCWYLQPRYCCCARNIFYLDLTRFLDFAFDYGGLADSERWPLVNTVQDASMVLRRIGRTPDMLVQSLQRSGNPPNQEPLRVEPIVPQDSKVFVDGFMKMWLNTCIIPMPRSMPHPVEQRRVKSNTLALAARQDTETLSEYEHRSFWRGFHEVTDEMVYNVELGRVSNDRPLDHGFGTPEPDLLDDWMRHCEEVGANPYDPCYDDEECHGFRCVRWVRTKMHETSVGGTSYPLELCLHRDDLTRSASRLGVDYLDRMYVQINRYQGGGPEWNTIDHRGILNFMGLRYENVGEDFVPWVLNTTALLHGAYAHMWLDGLGQWTRTLMAHLHIVATQTEDDMRFAGLQQRWRFLHSLCFAGPSVMSHTQYYTERTRERDQAAIHLVFNAQYIEQNRYISSLVDHGDLWTNDEDTAQRSRHFLTSLLEQYDHPLPNHRTESQRVQDAYRLIQFAEYLTDFAEYVGARVDDRTVVTRRRAFNIFLSSFMSLVMFCPGWKRIYHWKPSRTAEQTHWHLPRINLQHNHRFQRYLQYSNRRTLYYHLNPALLLNNTAQDATQGWRG